MTRKHGASKALIKRKPAKQDAHSRRKHAVFTIDCTKPVSDGIMDIAALQKYLAEHIKVENKAGALKDLVVVKVDGKKVTITSEIALSKRYLKYLTKRFLKKHNVRDWLRVIASNKDRAAYELRYFMIAQEDEEGEE